MKSQTLDKLFIDELEDMYTETHSKLGFLQRESSRDRMIEITRIL